MERDKWSQNYLGKICFSESSTCPRDQLIKQQLCVNILAFLRMSPVMLDDWAPDEGVAAKSPQRGKPSEVSFLTQLRMGSWPVVLDSWKSSGLGSVGGKLHGLLQPKVLQISLVLPIWHAALFSSSPFLFSFATSVLLGNLLPSLLPWSPAFLLFSTSVQPFLLFLLNQSTTPNNSVKYIYYPFSLQSIFDSSYVMLYIKIKHIVLS